ncbi:MAG: TonB-dependent receptor [Bacteroidia bacterium]|nr:TonB-dependent receptor [Bacteroidia bacterium]
MKKIKSIILILLLPLVLYSQNNSITGQVTSVEKGTPVELVGVNIYWQGTSIGAVSDINGNFEIVRVSESTSLVFSYIGYQKDTIETTGLKIVNVELKQSLLLDGVDITERKQATQISLLNPLKVETMNEKELQKAACCNISESFETNPSVDVSFTDAVTGTRQIQMLGLAGPYSQITRENIPSVRGLSSLYGLVYIPGAWVESIQLNKGTGSVLNGFESIAGQINVELHKPEDTDKLYLNAFLNQEGRTELNAIYAPTLKGEKWSTALFLHGNQISNRTDHNDDGFLDVPLSKHLIGLNRWKYVGDNGIRMQLGIKGTYVDNVGGQKDFDPDDDAFSASIWGMHVNQQRFEAWSKIGKVFDGMSWKSMGLQLTAISHEHESFFGAREYDAEQQSFYSNYVYQSIIGNTNHQFKTGASFQYDKYKEVLSTEIFNREEMVPGAYFEYTNLVSENFTAVAGLRADYHNNYGEFFTPRLHLRYAINDGLVARASAGKGQRTANIIADNMGLLASSRVINVMGENNDNPYGLDAERAWNYGFNLVQCFKINGKEGTVSADFYRTDFINQIIIDTDRSADSVFVYNLDGESYSNSIQLQVNYEIVKRLDVRLAYRWFDVQTTYNGDLKSKPLLATHRAFANLAYETPNDWKFDYTINWRGSQRVPTTAGNNIQNYRPNKSPDYILMNTQVTKSWLGNFDVYVGVENILDYTQDDPIIASDEPFGSDFDASSIWGPIFGRNMYVGLRYKIN